MVDANESAGDPVHRRMFYLKGVIAVGFFAGLVLSPQLWLSSRSYPTSPVFAWLPELGHPWDYVALGGMLMLLVGIVVHPRPKWLVFAFVLLAGGYSLFDQTRWQPWFYQYLFMFIALAFYPWHNSDTAKNSNAIDGCRIIVVATYFWSGLQKVNPLFRDEVFLWLFEPLTPDLSDITKARLLSLAVIAAITESLLGLGLLWPRLRNSSVVGIGFMHAVLLLCLGPLGHNWNTVVWPWNVTMTLLVIVLFWNSGSVGTLQIIRPRRALCHASLLVLFGLMPALNLVGRWDAYLSAALYSGNTMSASIFMSGAIRDRLPPEIQEQMTAVGFDMYRLDLSQWTMTELNVPAYPARRVFLNVARRLAVHSTRPDDVVLIIQERPIGWTKERVETRYDVHSLAKKR
jgi:hypothetical protein